MSTRPTITSERKRLGEGLFHLALRWSRTITTQTQRTDELRALKRRRQKLDGRCGLAYIRGEIEKVAERLARLRAARELRRTRPIGAPRLPRRLRPVLLPTGTLAERHTARLAALIAEQFIAAYRTDPAGAVKVDIMARGADRSATVTQTQMRDWDYYSKSCRTPGGFRPAKDITNTTLSVPHDWLTTVYRRGLIYVDSHLVLSVGRGLSDGAGIHVFRATWLEQSRGYTVRVQRGYIALHDNTGAAASHPDARGAVKKLCRVIAPQAETA